MKNILILSDNKSVHKYLMKNRCYMNKIANFTYAYSENNEMSFTDELCEIIPINLKMQIKSLISNYDIIISWHCKQIFPPILVNSVKCINIHPGLNPYNRGWFPQVFSIINKKPCGATIHVIDEKLDHGEIIDQTLVKIEDYDTSETAYDKIMQEEYLLFEKNISKIISGNYESYAPSSGNINAKQDFYKLLKLDLNKQMKLGECIDLLRALTFRGYKNAYFIDSNGDKVYVEIHLSRNAN